MMLASRSIDVLVAILALCQVAVAFYPFTPDYRCIQDPKCDPSRKSHVASVEGRTTSLKLKQRVPKSSESHATQIRNLGDRLARKYNRGTPVQEVKRGSVTFPTVLAATPTQTDSAGINQDGTDYSYFATVLIGSNETPLEMLLDTGAGNSWVMGSTCTSVPCTEHSTFGPEDSQTYTPLDGESFSVQYGTGDVSGTLANDTFSFAGLKLEMTLGIANVTSSDFSSYPMDGILGLSQLQVNGQPNFIQTLVGAKLLQSNVFGISISRSGDGPNLGEINFGAPDTSRFSGSLSYTSVASNGESDWAIPMDSIGWAGQDSGLTGRTAYLDTGTSFIFCPADDAKAFHALIPGSDLQSDGVTYHVPCTTTDAATVTFSGVTYNISSEDWVGPNVDGACTSNIYGQPVVNDGWLLGDTFLKNVYALFDVDQNRVGLAQEAEPSGPSPSTTSSAGRPNSLSDPSSSSPSSSSALTAGSPTATETNSNGGPTGSTSGTSASATGAAPENPGSTATGSPSSNQVSSASSDGLSASTSSPASPGASKTSGAIRIDAGLSFVALALLTTIAF